MKKVIFLDIDGVLNSEEFLRSIPTDKLVLVPFDEANFSDNQIDKSKVKLINQIIEETNAEIVISSFWRLGYSLQGLKDIFNHAGLKGQIIDVTPSIPTEDRNVEIKLWLAHNKVNKFVVIDDDLNAEIQGHFVKTSFQEGLIKEHVDKALEILK